MMSLISARLGALACIIALITSSYFQHLKIEALHAERQHAQQGNVERDKVIQALRQQASEHEAAQLALQQQLTRLHQIHSQRQATIQQSYETKTVRAWANARLPEPIIGLRQHADFIGTAAYAERLPQSSHLPTSRQRPSNKR